MPYFVINVSQFNLLVLLSLAIIHGVGIKNGFGLAVRLDSFYGGLWGFSGCPTNQHSEYR